MDLFEKQLSQKGFLITLRNKIFGLLGQYMLSNQIRIRLFSCMGVEVGKNVFIGKYCLIDDTFPDLISIEDNVNIAFGVTVVAHDASKRKAAKVLISKGAYIGTGAIILPGVVVGKNAIIGAGAVVNRNVADGTQVAGVPARVI